MGTPLGDFIRSRRDATLPESLGLPVGARRRAPGLRRTELAAAAGISVEYLTRIEQGRDRRPSISVVNALADALRLDPDQRVHLRTLVKVSGGECQAHGEPDPADLRPGVRALLDLLEPGIAFLTTRRGDIRAHTMAFAALAGPIGLLDAAEPNLARFVFGDPRARDAFPEWDRVADGVVHGLWAAPSGERSEAFIAELTAAGGDDVTRRLARHDPPPGGPMRWRHPDAGDLVLAREELELPAGDAQQIVVLLPADAVTAAAVDGLRRTAAGGLRAVR